MLEPSGPNFAPHPRNTLALIPAEARFYLSVSHHGAKEADDEIVVPIA